MDDPQSGPSRANPSQNNVFELFENNVSDEEDDFPIYHQSDESGECFDNDTIDLDLEAGDIDWREVESANGVDLDLNIPNFTQRGIEVLPELPAAAPQARVPGKRNEYRCYICSTPQQRRQSPHWCPACKVSCHECCEPQLPHKNDLGLQKRKRRRAPPDSDSQ
ncbi:hypothetical protein PoB_005336000 [Plakobranchus ocellatus]|uniref:PiggyBac transposable element-derived protein 4 C-terminal zinc-ribbon domain-containing protein n=1 Tax=Plakobranchus ocellatus TaxID=259542 RepID=A0AAV4C5B6_9GAST|nr:hypothetical protein PoB_005336000 [Plakobranchus ocellatus]